MELYYLILPKSFCNQNTIRLIKKLMNLNILRAILYLPHIMKIGVLKKAQEMNSEKIISF